MSRAHKYSHFVLTLLIVVALWAACCLGGALGAAGPIGHGGLASPSFLAPHSAPFSASGAAQGAKLRAMRGGVAMAPVCTAAARASADVTTLPTLVGGISIEPFSLRLRI